MDDIPEILIDRLALDVPWLTMEQAMDLSQRVGSGLAQAKPAAGSFANLTVELNEQAASHDLPRLAGEIVDSLLRQIG